MVIINLLSEGLVVAGAGILIAALFPVRRLIIQLPGGKIRARWYTLTGLISVFIIGYISYTFVIWGQHSSWADLIVPGVFFLGAGFVWLTANLSLQTATDVRRVTILERESIIDPLTEVYNRRYLDRRLNEECALARRHALPLSALLIDIDHFKQINDDCGHQVGDMVLSYLGRLLLQAIRETDIVARYGGDELMIIAPNTSTSMAGTLAERLRQHVETHQLVLTNISNNPQEVRFTVSIGVASLDEGIPDCQAFIQNIDTALYRAKQEGRNRTFVFDVKGPPEASAGG